MSGAALLSWWYQGRLRAAWSGRLLDFTGLAAGAYLVGTPGLYDVSANLEVQRHLVGADDPARVFPRWPYFAVLMRPFSWLPYVSAARVWMALMVIAFAAFVALFPATPRWITALTVCWSIPAFDALGQGQDTPLLLVFLGACLLLYRAGLPFAAGVTLALCAPDRKSVV